MAAAPPEVFVVVRPPPSKTTNPLNLQVQLLTAQPARPGSRASAELSRSPAPSDSGASFDAVAGASVGLRRSPSVRSNRSGGSAATASSTQTGGAGRRPIIPLYNLEFHNLRETLVTDAGTDAKVAKFLKRGIEIVGLAILDPVDLPLTSALTPSSSPPAPPTPSPPQTLAVPPPSHPTGPSFFSKFKRLSFKPPPFVPPKLDASPPAASTAQVLPLFPEQEPDGAKGGRPKSVHSMQGVRRQGYSFAVRKWTRRDLEGLAGAQAASEVRFEWRRARRRGKSSVAQQANSAGSAASSPEGKHITLPPMEEDGPALQPPPPVRTASSDFLAPAAAATRPGRSSSLSAADGGPSLASAVSRSPDRSPGSSINQEDDDGYQSDPEDSERPWVCEVVYGGVGVAGGPRRLLLGTLRPAPHHPRLVAHLAVPFSLAPVELGQGLPGGLSVEEMKDCLAVTGLWVIVRENLGGLSNRKKGRI